MEIFKINFQICNYYGEIEEGLLFYPNIERSLGYFIGYIEITLNNKIVTKYKFKDYSRIIDPRILAHSKTMENYIDDYIDEFFENLLNISIILSKKGKRNMTLEFLDSSHYLDFEIDGENLLVSFRCENTPSVDNHLYCHESLLKVSNSIESVFNEIIKASKDFLNQLIEINPRLKEWEGYQNLKNKLIELETLRNKPRRTLQEDLLKC